MQHIFLPIVTHTQPPAAVSAVVSQIALEGAQCPNDIAVNQHSGLVYVTNAESDSISILNDAGVVRTLENSGNLPGWILSDPHSERVYLTHLLGPIMIFEGQDLVNSFAGYHEPYNMILNQNNGYLYISDLHDRITVLEDGELVEHVTLVNGETGKTIAWNLAGDYDTETGLTYYASWNQYLITVMDGLTPVDQFRYGGQGASDAVIDSYRRLMYVANAHASQKPDAPQNINVINLDTRENTAIFTSGESRYIALEPTSGYAYVTDAENDTVTVLDGTAVKAIIPVGDKPWHILADPRNGHVYVANLDDNTISVLYGTEVVDTIALTGGFRPWRLTLNPETNALYVLNRSSYIYLSEFGTERKGCDTPYVLRLE